MQLLILTGSQSIDQWNEPGSVQRERCAVLELELFGEGVVENINPSVGRKIGKGDNNDQPLPQRCFR